MNQNEIHLQIHTALHDPDSHVVTLDGADWPILTTVNGARYMHYKGTKFTQDLLTTGMWIAPRVGRAFLYFPKTEDDYGTDEFYQPGAVTPDGQPIYGTGDYNATRDFWRQGGRNPIE